MTGIEQIRPIEVENRSDISNGPGKLVAALGIPQELYGKSIIDSPLHLVYEKKENRKNQELPRIGIPNKENGQQCHYDLLFPGIRTFRYKKEPDR